MQSQQKEKQIKTTIEHFFPSLEISQLAKKESWRKELNRPIYYIHKWWAKRLGSVFRAILISAITAKKTITWQDFYQKYSFSNKIICDPFMGSGTTLGEALKLGCNVVGCDINPISTFMVKQSLISADEKELRKTFSDLESKIAKDIKYYYKTRDPVTGEIITVLYYFWVKIVKSPHGEAIPLFTHYIFAKNAYPQKKPQSQILCPQCWNIIQDRFDSLETTCNNCHVTFNPQQGTAKGQYVISKTGKRYKIKQLIQSTDHPPEHLMYAILAVKNNGEKIYLPVKDYDLKLFQKAENRLKSENLPYPTLGIRRGYNTNQVRDYNYLQWRDFFNDRQLLCLGLLLNEILKIENQLIQEQFICLFSSILEFNNLFCTYKGEGTGAVRPLFSNHILKPEKTPIENSIWGTNKSSGTFFKLFESRLIPAKKYLKNPFELYLKRDLFGNISGKSKISFSSPININLVESWQEFIQNQQAALILNGNSQNLAIPDQSIDLIVTDPPYFDFIHYSELSDFFFAWLSPILGERYSFFNCLNSAKIGEVQHSDSQIFQTQLQQVFTECSRILKENGLLIFSFHHPRPEGWFAIYKAILLSGFKVVAAHPVYGELSVSSRKATTKDPISLDAILVCRHAGQDDKVYINLQEAKQNANRIQKMLHTGDLKLSQSDQFVILASQVLANTFDPSLSFEDFKDLFVFPY